MTECFAKLSTDCLRDCEQLSRRGRLDAAFNAGYLALLTAVDEQVRRQAEHPSEKVLVQACEALGVQHDIGTRYVRHMHDWHESELPSFEALQSWADKCRRRTVT